MPTWPHNKSDFLLSWRAFASYLTWSSNVLYRGGLTGTWREWVTLPFSPVQMLFLGGKDLVARDETSVWGSSDGGKTWNMLVDLGDVDETGGLWSAGEGKFIIGVNYDTKASEIWHGTSSTAVCVARTVSSHIHADNAFIALSDRIVSTLTGNISSVGLGMNVIPFFKKTASGCCGDDAGYLQILVSKLTYSDPELQLLTPCECSSSSISLVGIHGYDIRKGYYYPYQLEYDENGDKVYEEGIFVKQVSEDSDEYPLSNEEWLEKANELQSRGDSYYYAMAADHMKGGVASLDLQRVGKVIYGGASTSRGDGYLYWSKHYSSGMLTQENYYGAYSEVGYEPNPNQPGDAIEIITGYYYEDRKHFPSIIESSDGVSWCYVGIPDDAKGFDVLYGAIVCENETIVAVGLDWTVNEWGVLLVMTSTDSGRTWEASDVRDTPWDYFFRVPAAAGDLGQGRFFIAGEWSGKMIRSVDSGKTWSEMAIPGYLFNGNITVVSKVKLDAATNQLTGGRVVASVNGPDGPQLAYSTDQGLTWTLGALLPAANPIIYPFKVS